MQIVYLSYIHIVLPHTESLFNKMDFLNEYFLVILAYIMLNFTQLFPVKQTWLSQSDWNDGVSNFVIALIIIMVGINLYFMIRLCIHNLIVFFKKRKYKRWMSTVKSQSSKTSTAKDVVNESKDKDLDSSESHE